MSTLCPTELQNIIREYQIKTESDVLSDLKRTSELRETYPNIYLTLQLLPPLKPIKENLSKFAELYPFFIKACHERNRMYPKGFFQYKIAHTVLPITSIEQLSNLKSPITFILNKKSSLCTQELPIDIYTKSLYENNSLLQKFKSNIVIDYGNKNNSRYYPDEDIFKITINKQDCRNHQFITLVHNLGYINFWIKKFQDNINPYTLGNFIACQEAIIFDKQNLKNISDDLYDEFIHKELDMTDLLAFEIDLYRNLPEIPKTQFKANDIESPYLFLSQESFFTRPLEKWTHVAAFLSTPNAG